jgi:fumarate reductase flavoprotein subunit
MPDRSILAAADAQFSAEVDVLVVGGGGCGLTAALAAAQHGASTLVLERDASALGTTAMSTGLIPGAGTRAQQQHGVADSAELFAHDIMAKARGQTDPAIAFALASESAATIAWLIDRHRVPLTLVDSFLYPGHSVLRMHGTPNRTGSELMGALSAAVERERVDVLTEALVTELFADPDSRVCGARLRRPDGSSEDIGCRALVLACCGFAGNADMVAQYIPEIIGAIRWGLALGAAVRDIHAYQGHGGLAAGRGIPILWPLIMEGGFQVNALAQRFSNEALGYSEQAVKVVAQPGHVAWDIYDERLHRLMLEFDDYRDAVAARAVLSAPDATQLAGVAGLPAVALNTTIHEVAQLTAGEGEDRFGRRFGGKPVLQPPYYAVKVTGALFHTQGGLAVDANARVLRDDGSALPNLFAGGGAARGISGPSCWGYMAGNGLLTATTFGRLAGAAAARLTSGTDS